MIIAGTGHRPDKLGGYENRTRLALGGLATEYLAQKRPDLVISGMALGWDQALAGAAVALEIPFLAIIPFEGQERKWPEDARARYKRLLAAATEVIVISPWPSTKAMQLRNEAMVDRCDRVVALWDGSWGGTFNCVKYAEKKRVPIDHLWDRWSLQDDLWELLG
jgi:uncharacterized phage-like protein YoqJ